MKRYECLFIVSADMDGEGTSRVTKKVEGYLQANGGEVANVQHWGKRKLAYLIDKQRYGAYVLMHFSGESPDLAAFQHELELDGEIMAYMTVRLDKFPDFDSLTIPQAYDTERKRGDRGDRRRDRDDGPAPRAEAKPATEDAGTSDTAEAESATEAPAEDTPAEDTPAEDAAADDAPAEEAVEESTEEAPAEEAVEEVTEEATEESSEEKPEEDKEAPATEPEAETESEDAGEVKSDDAGDEASDEPDVEEAAAEEESAEADDEKEGE